VGWKMLNRRMSSVALVLLASSFAVAQDSSPQGATTKISVETARFSKRAIRLTGKLSDDGQFLIADPDQEVWTIINPQTTSRFAGQGIAITAQTSAEGNELRVLIVKPERTQLSTMARWSDSAFRR
jgi:hypothetical protein